MIHYLHRSNNFLLRKKGKSLVVSTSQLIVFLRVQLPNGHMLFALNLVLTLGSEEGCLWTSVWVGGNVTGFVPNMFHNFSL